MGVIKIFGATDRDFTSNGDKILKPTKCLVHTEDNGECYADIECSLDYSQWMIQDNIVVIDGQGYRLNNPQISNNKMQFRARHVSYDAEKRVVQTIEVDNYTAAAICQLMNSTYYPADGAISVSCGIQTVIASCRLQLQSLSDCIDELCKQLDAHVVRDNWNISIVQDISVDHEKTIAIGKNIKIYQQKEDWNDVCTALIAVGSDGTVLDESVLISATQYAIPYAKTVTFSPREGVDTTNVSQIKDDLRQQSEGYLEEHQYPKMCYTVDAHRIGDVVIGEVIQLKHQKLRKDLTTNVYAIEKDAITGKQTKVTFGNFFDGIKNTIKSNIKDKFISMYRDIKRVDTANKVRFEAAEDHISAEVSRSTAAEGNMSARIDINAEGISKRVEKNKVISEINQSAEEVGIIANKIRLEGLVTANERFKVHSDGSMSADQGYIKNSQFRDMYYVTEGGEVFPLLTGSYVNAIHMLAQGQYLWFDGIMNIDYDHLMVGVGEGGYKHVAVADHTHTLYTNQIIATATEYGNVDFAGGLNAASVDYVQNNFARKSELESLSQVVTALGNYISNLPQGGN